jgi:dGTPase
MSKPLPGKGAAMVNQLTEEQLTARLVSRDEDVRGPYFRDQTAIIHSMPFRRLKHKTQFLFNPENDHICTRIEHVLHVATIAGTICRGLSRGGWELDGEMAYAAGLGHDLGHAPFGHSGERELQKVMGNFRHETHSLRVVDRLSADGRGLNLTFGVRDAILCHNGELFEQYLEPDGQYTDPAEKAAAGISTPSTLEGCVVRFSDKIAYLGRDVEDALRARLIQPEELPEGISRELRQTNGQIINTLVIDIIEHSLKAGRIGFSDGRYDLISRLRQFNYGRIYFHPRLVRYQQYCAKIIAGLCEHLLEGLQGMGRMPGEWAAQPLACDRAFGSYLERMAPLYDEENAAYIAIVCDFVAGMTDNYALKCHAQLTQPEPIEFED